MVQPPCALVELGSGSSNKTKVLIDIILQRQPVLKYVPIDISEGKYILIQMKELQLKR